MLRDEDGYQDRSVAHTSQNDASRSPRSRKTKEKEEKYTEIDKTFVTWKGNIHWIPLKVYFLGYANILKTFFSKNSSSGKNENFSNNGGRGDKACWRGVTDAGKQPSLSQCLFRNLRDVYTWTTSFPPDIFLFIFKWQFHPLIHSNLYYYGDWFINCNIVVLLHL